jgi:DNA-binding transcriptional LysR family regulator
MVEKPGMPTLDQLTVFLAIVETGSFAAAARRLGRATSVMSYAVANLEAQLGVQLFDRTSTKKPRLTEVGQTVLAEARTVAADMDGLRAKVRGLLRGLEPEIVLSLDVMLPAYRIVDALRSFQREFPTVRLRLHMEALGAVTQMVQDRSATLGITGPVVGQVVGAGLSRIWVGDVALVPVAAPDHPLANAPSLRPGDVSKHVQLVLTDRSSLTKGVDFAVLSPHTWRLADLGSKHMLLRAGVGWGRMPLPMVQDDIETGRLVLLDSPDARSVTYWFEAIHRTDSPPGPAGAWLIEHFKGQANA